MRILHTSDWHLGRSFHREGLLGHQGAFVDHLLEVVAAERVDVVVVSGDVYDRALPHVDAVALADEAFARLAASRARVVVSSGNHDSARRLGFGSRLMDAAGVFVRTDASSVGTPVVLADEHGDVAFHAIPYLDPSALLEPWALGRRSHDTALTEAMRRVRADLDARPATTRSVVLAHAFVAGATPSESERDISVGGVSRVATSVFDGIDYTALGHLHGPHVLADGLRYSGSPLAYSFSEADQAKGSWLVELGASGLRSATWIDAPVPRRLARITGTLTDLLADPTLAVHEDAWVQAVLTDDRRPARAMEQLRRRFPHTLVLQFPTPAAQVGAPARPADGTSDHAIALDFVQHVRGSRATDAESALLREAIEACCHDPDQDVLVGAAAGPTPAPGGAG
ncbi:exonuclease SbcCD subunit D [Nocardioides sp. zg-1228]|uniref:exonuclease SbcCD subunit D n=1 Tax=Nocardioides sp. zg-1228 TaxID=2763008 RepID=UPI00164264E8|nr:exonuclease SbcCD subunit D [Nocardioides sp. zg-1228]MBC2934663.1 exonuclease SbcCD subunit D [Nocardioides sp. zg-1228]QSF55982.1 exonuclease SbcCD subunit D [Nocardioides sp. zg-1228]